MMDMLGVGDAININTNKNIRYLSGIPEDYVIYYSVTLSTMMGVIN